LDLWLCFTLGLSLLFCFTLDHLLSFRPGFFLRFSFWTCFGFWFSLGFGPELKACQCFLRDLKDCFAILVTKFCISVESLTHFSRDISYRLSQGLFSFCHLVKWHAVKKFCVQCKQNNNLIW